MSFKLLSLDSWTAKVLAAATLYGIWWAFHRVFLAPFLSPLRGLPGPKPTSFVWGSLREVFDSDPAVQHMKWVEEYGPTMVYKGIFNSNRVMTLDSKALSHILSHSYNWQKPSQVRKNLASVLGEGVLFAEGDTHKRQRRIMNPSFSRQYIRELTVIFHNSSQQLRDILFERANETDEPYKTNIMTWLSKATLDIIGLAGFDYQFNALDPSGKENELNTAFSNVMKQGHHSIIWVLAQSYIPVLRFIPTARGRLVKRSREVMDRVGNKLVHDKKQAILQESAAKTESGKTQIERSSITTRDLLSRLMAANMATDLPDNQRLSDEDVLAQIPTFLIAGHETTATVTTWALYALTQNPEVQKKLRNELLAVENNAPDMDEINALPYLDGVVRETLRLYSPVPSTVRVATQDDVVPLGVPVKDKNGILRNELRVKKGDTMFLPILCINMYKGYWGEDAQQFNPDRWGQQSTPDIPGVFGGILTFLGGPRSCIGYRFALVEFKCLLFHLVRSLQFELAVPAADIGRKTNIVTRPFLTSEPKAGPQLPLRITPYRSA
ncbi:cytochrome P450 [Hysterangium stoloniferum]|nr:cytochrome P450 [Hysterangium stoloniferum]